MSGLNIGMLVAFQLNGTWVPARVWKAGTEGRVWLVWAAGATQKHPANLRPAG